MATFYQSGTGGRTRTDTGVSPGDFESPASTNFATPAYEDGAYYTGIERRVNDLHAPGRYHGTPFNAG